MIIRSFPDFSVPDHDLDAPCPIHRFPNAFLLTENRELYYPDHAGPLSILCNFHGQGEYLLQKKRFVVHDATYLILNAGQRFANIIRSEREVQSLHIWFQPGFAQDVLRTLAEPADRLLDAPEAESDAPVTFVERTYRHDDTISPLLLQIRSAIMGETITPGWKEEQFHILLEKMLAVHRGVCVEIEQIGAARPATRVELYRRLHTARDFIEAGIADDISLDDMAGVACMSPHHFLRLFKSLFGRTPHQYLTAIRLERARALLTGTDLPIGTICRRIGFKSPGSFSWLFRRHHGSSPEAYRLAALRDIPPS